MRTVFILLLLFILPIATMAGDFDSIEIGTFNIRFFPCNQDGEMMKQYNIEMRYPPKGAATDTTALFQLLKELDIELLGVQEIVDPPLFGAMAKRHMGKQWEFIYAPSNAWQKVGLLYNSDKLELIGRPQIYAEVALGQMDRHRPALRGYFKVKNNGFDFHAIVVHLKSGPRGYDRREQQWKYLQKILQDLPGDKQNDADIILMGDFNNVSDKKYDEFSFLLKGQNYYWVNSEQDTLPSEYWRPNWKEPRLQGGTIDQLFISSDAKVEYVEGSVKVAGYCADGKKEIVGEFPEYYQKISDHCPVYGTFESVRDDD